MATFELLAALFFLGLAIAALAGPVVWPRRLLVFAAALVACALVAAVARVASDALRAWAPHLYLILGYWLPALLAPRPTHATRFERWLIASDARLRSVLPTVPPALADVTELAYLVCYPLVPASFIVVWTRGTPQDVNRFWLAVLAAAYVCYASVPWLVGRPPRLLPRPQAPARPLGAVNAFVLGRVSHQLNTFPSGHVAVAVAAALIVGTTAPVAGALVAAAATAIAVGAAAGRYHFVIDVLAGAVTGVLAAALALAA